MSGTLFVVATPIGNLEDITLRALRVLKEVSLVAAEDTRHSRKLLTHFGISTPLVSCHEHNERQRSEQLIERLLDGESIALISDAGTPGISDPGRFLVARCHEEAISVRTVPGPSAVTAALSVAGQQSERFAFEGFLPPRKKAREQLLSGLSHEQRTLVFYEAPHRLAATLEAVARLLGEQREVAVARELTKIHEEFFRGSAKEAVAHFQKERVRGEIVLLVAADTHEREQAPDVKTALQRLAQEGNLPPSELVRQAARLTGIGRSEVYRFYLRLKDQGELK
ncbi:MAG: 16S rRNA (cytidine(1402)-2'-O)-methyltransferase [Geoalkalibacter sp.]|uniref:16S rRNA (cytidine(1402)-2'-O)-methyltransferase n=1 Tax=Geoalkalibacter sp. TaxID=3041440 RepID=UPI002A93EE2B|nr:16S rRNA (cytidine(1402)-2'-O)-methyltransferase [Thermodesulfobacteriota bacterium]